jgi:glycerophosphoryl diester phosphodiesterase
MRQLLTRAAVLAFLGLTAGGCATRPPQLPDLGARLDCLRERHLGVVAAHRGQPDPSAAENAMSSFTASFASGVPFLEIDVATTRDGVMVLMHDDTLDRTTTGKGPVISRTWAEIRALRLKRPDGAVLDERVPLFVDVLRWGRKIGAHFEVDVKKTTKWTDVVDAVRAAGMDPQVVVVTYNLADARTVHELNPRLMISVTLGKGEDLETLRRAVTADRVMEWVGEQQPDAGALSVLRDAGIEPILGTLGRPGQRLDDQYVADGNPSEYEELVRSGVVMIASDRAVVAQRAIGFGYRACWPQR